MAHQGHSFATAQEARVVYRPNNDADEPVDVPKDGKTVGEVVMRGNIVMKEVCFCVFDGNLIPFSLNISATTTSTSAIRMQRARPSAGAVSTQEIWL